MRSSSAARQLVARAPLAAVLIVLLPNVTAAQDPVMSFDQLNTRLKVGDTVWVTDAQGREIKGQIRELGPSALTLKGDSVGTLQSDAVRLVKQRKGKPVGKGAMYGLFAGALAGSTIGAIGGGDDGGSSDGWYVALGAAIFGGIGAGAGAIIGAVLPGKEVVVYRAPFASGSTRLSLVPVITPRTKGAVVAYSF